MIINFLEFHEKSVSIFGLSIQYYALCILTGVIFATILGVKEAKRFGIAPNLILDGVLICVPLAILGARLYYVFTSWSDFVVNDSYGNFNLWETFLAIIGFRDGTFKLEGLAINGGIIVAMIFVPVYCKIRKINILHVFDLLAPGMLIGQICGRWGNFFNQEAHGPGIADKPSWLLNLVPDFIMNNMTFESKVYNSVTESYEWITKTWHPTFFYEAMWNLIAFVVILVSRRINKKQRVGDSVAFYLLWYGLGRSLIIEPLRMDPLLFSESLGPDFWYNRVNIVINLLLALGGLVWLILKHTVFKEPYYLDVQKEVKENKIDGVICRLDETIVSMKRLISNAYYYAAKEKLGIELSDEETLELVKKDPKEYFQSPEVYEYYLEYFNSHLNQMDIVLDVKSFFKTLYKHDYKIAVMSSYSKEVVETMLEVLKITTYVSVIVDKDLTQNQIEYAFNACKDAKHILVISSKADDILAAQQKEALSCLVYFGEEIDASMEYGPNHVINKVEDLNYIIIE